MSDRPYDQDEDAVEPNPEPPVEAQTHDMAEEAPGGADQGSDPES